MMRAAPAGDDFLLTPQPAATTQIDGAAGHSLRALDLLGNDGRDEGENALRGLRIAHQRP